MRFSFFALLLLFCFENAHASENFTVKNVAVDVEASSAIDAREKAMIKARKDAFRVLSARFLSDEALKTVPQASDRDIAMMVENFEINREKLSKNRYLASINMTFNPRAVSAYLGRYASLSVASYETENNAGEFSPFANGQFPATETKENLSLLLPWYKGAATPSLWKDPNPWRDGWVRWSQTSAAKDTNLVVPIGDITDMQLFNPEKPLSFDHNALERLLNRYGASQAIIAMATPLPNGMVRVSLYETTTLNPRFIERIVAAGGTGQNSFLPAIYQSANKVQHAQNQSTDEQTIPEPNNAPEEVAAPSFSIDHSPHTLFEAEIPLSSIQQWIGIKQSLSVMTGISAITVRSLSADHAIIAFDYAGNPEALRANLRNRGLLIYTNPKHVSGSAPYIIVQSNS